MEHRRDLLLVMLLAVVLTAVCHGATLWSPFLWDDMDVVTPGGRLLSPREIPSFFGPRHWLRPDNEGVRPYRPLRDTWLALIAGVAGHTPWPYHLGNLLLQALNVVLVFLLARRLLPGRWPPLLAALFFAVQPMHVEAVSWVKNAAEMLSVCLALAAALAFMRAARGSRGHGLWALSVVLYLAAVLAKEAALPLCGILALWALLWLEPGRRARAVAMTAPFWVIGLLYVAYQYISTRSGGAQAFARHVVGLGPGERLWLSGATVLKYLGMLFFPITHKPIYTLQPPPAHVLLPVLLIPAAGLLLAALLVRHVRERRRGALGFWWILFALGPVANLLAVDSTRPLAEQRLYFATVGQALLLAVCFTTMPRLRRVQAGAALVIAVSWLALCVHAAPWWQSHISFWTWAFRVEPENQQIAYNLGVRYAGIGREPQAQAAYLRALKLAPDSTLAAYNLGNSYYRVHEYALAAEYHRRALTLTPTMGSAAANLGMDYWHMDEPEKARAAFERGFQLNPSSGAARNGLASYYLAKGAREYSEKRYDNAVRALDRGFHFAALAGNPPGVGSYAALASSLAQTGERARAAKVAAEGLRRYPDNADLRALAASLEEGGGAGGGAAP